MTRIIKTVVVLLLTAGVHVCAAEEALNPHLAFLTPLLGKTMKGVFTTSTPEKPIIDVQHWEAALNGQAVRLTHSINNGVYGGESILQWDEEKSSVVYYYFTTAGFMTTGTMTTNAGHIVAREEVHGDSDGITEVRSTSEIAADGALHVKAEFLKNGQWAFGHEATYHDDPTAQVIFQSDSVKTQKAQAQPAGITMSFPSMPVGQFIGFFQDYFGTPVAVGQGISSSKTIWLKTADHETLTKPQAKALMEEALKDQAGVIIVTNKAGALEAVPAARP